jgi:hypothetical protein
MTTPSVNSSRSVDRTSENRALAVAQGQQAGVSGGRREWSRAAGLFDLDVVDLPHDGHHRHGGCP